MRAPPVAAIFVGVAVASIGTWMVVACSNFGGGETTSSSSSSGGGEEAGADGSSGNSSSSGELDTGAPRPPGRDAAARSVPCITKTCTGTTNCCVHDQIDESDCVETCGTDPLVACDDTTDCPEGWSCCIDLGEGDNNALIGATCQPKCAGGVRSERACSVSMNDCDAGCVSIFTKRSLRPPYPFFICQ